MIKREFDIIYVTNLPAFYKKRLLNEISQHKKIFVIYVGYSGGNRNRDFFNEDEIYESVYLRGSVIFKIIQTILLLRRFLCKEIIIGGWDSIINWAILFLCSSEIKSVVVESSVHESCLRGIKKFLKFFFLKHIQKAYVPGKSNINLLKALNYKGEIIKTKGVGIFNIQKQQPYVKRSHVNKYLFVGRLAYEKNLAFLISVFNSIPQLELNIVGFGAQEIALKEISNSNIHFLGPINNKELYKIYQDNDVFILPSIIEPWGLVVEEALNNGLPVIVSDKVGCAEELVDSSNGLVFVSNDKESLLNCIFRMQDIEFYNNLRYNISNMNFETIVQEQVQCYL